MLWTAGVHLLCYHAQGTGDAFSVVPRLLAWAKAEGTSVVLVEQDIVQAMKVADRVYCFQEGRLSLAGRPQELTREQIHRAYFGS